MTKMIPPFLSGVLYPTMCMICNEDHTIGEESKLCFGCLANMPWTNHFKTKKNAAAPKLWGRLPCLDVASMINFYSHTNIKAMIHRLKYEGRKDIGYYLGRMAGLKAKESPFFKDIDLIVPIPLHETKRIKRGYNQAAYFGEGVSDVLEIPMHEGIVIKTKHTVSQTKLSRVQRVQNVFKSFELTNRSDIEGKHVLIVDDVLTTGATIEACGNRLLEARGVKISVLTACIARR